MQINNEFNGLLLLLSLFIGLAFINILDVESYKLNVNELIEEVDDADFLDINDLVPNISQLEVETLAIRLTN